MRPSFLAEWSAKGVVTPEEAARLDAVESGRVFSVHRELRVLLYLGAALFIAGVSAVVAKNYESLGEMTIVAALLGGLAACAWYCAPRTPPYSDSKVESPTAAYDYVLYLGCALLGVLAGFLEARHHLLGRHWDWYLLASGLLFAALAFRCDNRLVLTLGLVNVAGWWGLHFKEWDAPGIDMKARAIVFGLASIAAGRQLAAANVKPHFEDTLLTAGLHPICWALLADVFMHGAACWQFWALMLVCGGAIAFARARRRFAYFLYGAFYAYVGVSAAFFHAVPHSSAELFGFYFLISAAAAVGAILLFRRSLEERD